MVRARTHLASASLVMELLGAIDMQGDDPERTVQSYW
jgi:hypothetical protein